jgi:hypothetical protein
MIGVKRRDLPGLFDLQGEPAAGIEHADTGAPAAIKVEGITARIHVDHRESSPQWPTNPPCLHHRLRENAARIVSLLITGIWLAALLSVQGGESLSCLVKTMITINYSHVDHTAVVRSSVHYLPIATTVVTFQLYHVFQFCTVKRDGRNGSDRL